MTVYLKNRASRLEVELSTEPTFCLMQRPLASEQHAKQKSISRKKCLSVKQQASETDADFVKKKFSSTPHSSYRATLCTWPKFKE
jgi:hypothetical protein